MTFKLLDDAFRAKISTLCPALDMTQISDSVLTQLMYATNEFELKRAVYRMQFFLEELAKAIPLTVFKDMTAARKEALLALTAIDACKGSEALLKDADVPPNNALPKDTVVWFFETLKRMPEIYPAFQGLSENAKEIIVTQLFYLHERHVFFGEVPVSALAELTSQSHENLQLLHAFWMINLLGFHGDKKATSMQIQDFSQMQSVLDDVVTKGSMEPLVAFYKSFDVPEEIQENPDAIIFLGRLMKLLSGDPRTSSSLEACFLALKGSADSIISVARDEKACYEKQGLLAVTFLPGVFWVILELAKKELLGLGVEEKLDETKLSLVQKELLEFNKTTLILQSLGVFLQLQSGIFKTLEKIDAQKLGGNRAISMQFLKDKSLLFLNDFRKNPMPFLDLDIRLNGALMEVQLSFSLQPTLMMSPVSVAKNTQAFLFAREGLTSSTPDQNPLSSLDMK